MNKETREDIKTALGFIGSVLGGAAAFFGIYYAMWIIFGG